LSRKYEVDESYWLVRHSRSFSRHALFTLRRAALTFRWGRVPKTWELFFIDRMKELEETGLTFDEVLHSTLPQLFGEDPSQVLRFWIGRKARRNPERFARSVSEMFGSSARSVLGGIELLSVEMNLFEMNAPQEPPYQSLLDAIQKSDATMTVAQLNRPQGRP
jgi:hypothetical protein